MNRSSLEQDYKKRSVDTDSDYTQQGNFNECFPISQRGGESSHTAHGESDSSLSDVPVVTDRLLNALECQVPQKSLKSIRGVSSPQPNKIGRGMDPHVIQLQHNP